MPPLTINERAAIHGRRSIRGAVEERIVFLFSLFKSSNANNLINKASHQNSFVLEHSRDAALCLVPNGIPIGFKMAEEKLNRLADKQTYIFVFIIVEIPARDACAVLCWSTNMVAYLDIMKIRCKYNVRKYMSMYLCFSFRT